MTLATKIIFIIALIVSIIVPFGYYLLGEKSKKRYKRAIGTNAFSSSVHLPSPRSCCLADRTYRLPDQ